MAGLNFIGSYSGIDQSAIDKLMEVERLPLKKYTTQKTSITEQQNAWKDINTRLNSLFEKMKALKSPDIFNSNKATSSNNDILGMTASKDAITGTYKVSVQKLATSTSISGTTIKDAGGNTIKKATDILGQEGKFTIKNHDGKTVEIEIDKEDSLQSVAKKINEAVSPEIKDADGKVVQDQGEKIGIRATVVGNRLVLTDEKTGQRNISLDDNGSGTLSKLGLTNIDESHYNYDEDPSYVKPEDSLAITEGLQAKFSINGIGLTSDSNNVTDAIEGATISLKAVHETGKSDTITIGLDTDKSSKAIKEFVDQLNSTMKFIDEKLAAGDPDKAGSRGTLAGDGGLMRLQSTLRNLVTAKISSAKGEIQDISQLGVATKDRYGDFQFDSEKLTKMLKEDPEKVMKFFFNEVDGKEVGLVAKVNKEIDAYISKENGIIKTKNESFDRTLKDIAKQIEAFEARMVKKEEQLIKKFTALDVAMMQAESQMTWLQGQVDAMNGIKR